jgi:flagellin
MIINFNESAAFASRVANINNANAQKTMNELASGKRINSAKDDASGLAVSTKMKSMIRGLNQASRNIADGSSMLNVASGYLQETTDILQRIRELAVQSANGIYSDEQRSMIQIEVSQLVSEVDRIASSATFNGLQLFTGRFAIGNENITLHIGSQVDQRISFNLEAATAEAFGLKGSQGEENSISINTPEEANLAISTIDEALLKVSKQQALIGANQNRMEVAKQGIDIASENMSAANSRIEDADMAKSFVEMSKNQILSQSVVAMLSQANSQSQNVLALLK